MKIKNQRQQKHLRRLIPERVLRLTAFRCGILKQVRHKALNIIIIPQIDKRIVTVAFLHIDEIDHLDFIALRFQQITCVPQKFAFGVKTNKAGIRIHHIGFCKKARLASTAAAAAQNIQISSVLSTIKSDCNSLRQDFIFWRRLICILSTDFPWRTPLC